MAMFEAPASSQQGQLERTQGRFQDGEWYCDCDPPRKGVLLQVQKDNGNKGKWFRKCAKPQGQQCTFWLWERAAEALEKKAREKAAQEANKAPGSHEVAGGTSYPAYSRLASTTESDPLLSPDMDMTPVPRQRIFRGIPRPGLAAGSDSEDSDATERDDARRTGTRRAHQDPALATTPNPNRKRPAAEDQGPGQSFNTLSSVTAIAVDSDSDDEVMDEAASARHPVQAQQRRDGPATPRSQRATHIGPDGLPTPQPSRNKLLIASEPAAKRRMVALGMSGYSPATPSRSRNALAGWDRSSSAHDSQDDGERDWQFLADDVWRVTEELRLERNRRRVGEKRIELLTRELRAQDRKIAELEALVCHLQTTKSTDDHRALCQQPADN